MQSNEHEHEQEGEERTTMPTTTTSMTSTPPVVSSPLYLSEAHRALLEAVATAYYEGSPSYTRSTAILRREYALILCSTRAEQSQQSEVEWLSALLFFAYLLDVSGDHTPLARLLGESLPTVLGTRYAPLSFDTLVGHAALRYATSEELAAAAYTLINTQGI